MTSIQAIQGAARRLGSRKRMIFLYWFAMTIISALVALPISGIAVSQLSHSKYGLELLENFDFMWLMEAFFVMRPSPLYLVVPSVLLAVTLMFLSSLFLAGGSVSLLIHDAEEYTPAAFWRAGGNYFWRFLRLALYSLLLYGIANSIFKALANGVDKIWGEGMVEQPIVYATWVITALRILVIGSITTAMDYAKVRLVVDESRKSFRACFGSFALVWKHPAKTLGVWLVLALLWLVFGLIYNVASNALTSPKMGVIAALIVCQQLYIFGRIWLRMLSWGAAAELDPVLRPRALPPEEFIPVMANVPEAPPAFEAGAEAEPQA